ncbi:uncharacterized protein LOC110980905 [Acanthaster planci]|uniref:Uncharacterized protein LOC110980905 n=1 Tax=Acanthaster planci TaxID=133434 RepID=A0A8B7YLX4_ACAPL|nr:uncharacterized protein LOC110980905 [Acanthaster planci]
MTTYYNNPPAGTSAYVGGSFSRGWTGDSRGEVEAFIWRCRQDNDGNFWYKNDNNREMDSASVTMFLNMLTDVNTRCRVMEEQLTDLQKHAQRVTSQLDSMVSQPAKRASSSSNSSSGSTSVSTADTLKAIRKLQWKIFDLQRENEALRAVLEMQRAKEQSAEAEVDEPPQLEDTETSPKSAKKPAWAQPGIMIKTPQNTPVPAMVRNRGTHSQQEHVPSETAHARPSDTRIVLLTNSEDGLTSTEDHQQECCECPQEGGRCQPGNSVHHSEGGGSSELTKDYQNEASGSSHEFSQPLETKDTGQRSGYQKQLKTDSTKESSSTPSRYPYTRWVSSKRKKTQLGVPLGRQTWCWTSHHPRLFPQVSTTPSARTETCLAPEPRYQSTPRNSCSVNSKDAGQNVGQPEKPAGTSETSANHCQWHNPREEGFSDYDRHPCAEQLTDVKLEDFTLYASPEDIQLVQGTLELLNSINNLEYRKDGEA